MNYEELVKELTRIKNELEDINVSSEVDEITIEILHAYLRHATIDLINSLRFLEYKIKQLKGGKEVTK